MKKVIIGLILLPFCVHTKAQLTNTGNLELHTGAAVSVFGKIVNTSSGAFVNNGDLFAKWNIFNDQASMTVGTGTLYMNGTVGQTVCGGEKFRTFNLVTNNNGGVSLMTDLDISGTHTFIDGLIFTNSNFLIYEAGSSYTGDNDSRHVNGGVKKYGSTDFTFPVGGNGFERTATIKNLSVSSEINCRYFPGTQNTSNLAWPLVKVDAQEYWDIEKVTGGTAKIMLNWNHAKVPFLNVLTSELLVAHYTGGNWISEGGSASGNVSTTGTITSGTINSFSPFTFGSINFPLPLHLISFTGKRQAGATLLHWVSDNEQNVDRFEVERSDDASVFRYLGQVAARNLSYRQDYDFTDNTSIQGKAWYRLRIIDQDGGFEYSKVVMVSESALKSKAFLVQNPVQTGITIFNKTGHNGSFECRLINAAGQVILNENVNMTVNNPVVLRLPPVTAAGLYLLEIRDGKSLFTSKVLVAN